ncbi:hypothetical protein FHX37_4217 [Haloactinospora alba]|uniref:Uncharacterized protein n=1 Tax=Haloactinospora alba TaxID=405555 RepID=A0A543N6R8_9ACTN|nr:hypothetical protein [Haloactinospora alba]TQN27497.1 hypothetical protein FHX37_4217 [Haloactinospora alba]
MSQHRAAIQLAALLTRELPPVWWYIPETGRHLDGHVHPASEETVAAWADALGTIPVRHPDPEKFEAFADVNGMPVRVWCAPEGGDA